MTQPAAAIGWDRIRVAIPRVVEAGFAIFVVVILGAVMTVKSDVFLTTGNLQNILLQTSFLACAAFGMTLVIIAAELDLSQGSVLALIGVVAAETMVRNNSIVLGLLAGVGVGIAAGLFNGLVTAVLRGRADRWPSTGRCVVPALMSGSTNPTTRWRYLSLCARWNRRW